QDRPPTAESEPFVRIPGVDEVLVRLARLQPPRQHGDEHLGSVPHSAQREEVLMGVDDRATTEEIVDGIRAALTTRDPRVLESHLADDARWESCVGREQVIEYMESAARLDVALESVTAHPDRIALTLRIADQRDLLYQVVFVRDGKIVEFRAVGDSAEALTTTPSPPPPPATRTTTSLSGRSSILPMRCRAAAI